MGSDTPQSTVHSLIMRNILQFSLVFLCFLSHLTEAIFFGPVAIGLGIGILAAKKGFLIGTALASSRTRRSYQPTRYHYTPQHHYDTSYNRYYQKPRRHYYYSSSPYYGRRGKRDTEYPEMVELKRIKREVEAGGFDINTWYRDMTEMDQDGCGKKLICELRAKQKSGFTADEKLIAENFGSGTQVDVSDITVEYDLAAQLGKYMGLDRCQQLYNRCDLSSSDMIRMIKTEMDTLDEMKKDLENEEVEVELIEKNEVEETEVEFRKLQADEDDSKVNWLWTQKIMYFINV